MLPSGVMRLWIVRALALVVLTLVAVGCSPTLKHVNFQFDHRGTTIKAKKHFNVGFGLDPSYRAWHDVKKRDYDKAIETMLEIVAQNPDNAWALHNLAILYEAKGDWNAAEKTIRECIAVDERVSAAEGRSPTRAFQDELEYILRYKPAHTPAAPVRVK